MKKVLILLFGICLSVAAYSQVVTTPQPCTNPPSGVGCSCNSAGILCTPDDLDGFSFAMSSTPNTGGLPAGFNADLCPGDPAGGIPNNVNWFAFVAWCTDLSMNISLTDCNRGTQGGNTNDWGVQIALFGSCGSGQSGWNTVECLTESGVQCGDNSASFPTSFTISASGLTIGQTYYFMVDGCNGSYCTVTIDVVGTCGTGEIDDWTTGITGPDTICLGDNATYVTEDLDGAVQYYYYLNGTQIATGTELLTVSPSFPTPGTYQLCVDVANLPCVLEADDPAQYCKDIVVCPAANPGTINATPNPTCPGNTVSISVSGYNTAPGFTQYIVITNDLDEIISVVNGDATTITSDICEIYTVYSLNTKADYPEPVVGTLFPSGYPPCEPNCCRRTDITVRFEDNEAPTFTNPPQDLILTCIDDVPPATDLPYTDNCIGNGTVMVNETGSADMCDGGIINREWMITDSCGNTATHAQRITVNPLPPPVFTNPPADITLSCENIPNSLVDLNYTNGLTNSCAITGSVSPTTSGSPGLCGGSITNTWEYTDMCDRTITHTQNITITPAADAQFINPPADLTVNCGEAPTTFPDLMYTNNLSGICLIEGTASPIVSGTTDICGGTIEITWEFTDACGKVVSHMQSITVNSAPIAAFVNLPSDMTVTCDQIPPPAGDLAYTNNVTGPCVIEGSVSPTIVNTVTNCGGTITNTWTFTDACNRPITHVQIITVQPPPQAQFEDPPASITVNCDALPGAAPNLQVSNGAIGTCLIEGTVTPTTSGTPSICGGTITNVWTFNDICGRPPITYTQTITITPAPPPVFDAPPADITIDCSSVPPAGSPLSYTNSGTAGCLIEGQVAPTRSGTVNACGGQLVDTWTFTDQCGRTITASRRITVTPAEEALFINPPTDVTVDCDDIPAANLSLSYTNGASGSCAIEGSVNGAVSNNYGPCGGTILQFWVFTDACGRTLTHNRTITVNPSSAPYFVNPPDDVTLECGETYTPPVTLAYTNGISGPCGILGSAIVTLGQGTGTVIHTWQFTNPCDGTIITHEQQVTSQVAPSLIVNPQQDIVCIGSEYNLNNLTVFDLNNTFPNITFHSGIPATPANELPDVIVMPSGPTTYYILGVNDDGCSDEIPFMLNVDTPLNAGEDAYDEVCQNGTLIDLYDYLSADADLNGFWFDLDNTGLDVNNPNFININNYDPGTYTAYYITPATQVCEGDTAVVTLVINQGVNFNITKDCEPGGDTYIVTVTGVDIDVTGSAGVVSYIDDTTFTISNIPIAINIEVFVSSTVSNCTISVPVLKPNCSCPDVPTPAGTPSYKGCIADVPITMTANVGSGLQANWYTSAVSTTPIATNVTTYDHTNITPGVYTYYVEALDPTNGCVSDARLAITVEIVANPSITNRVVAICDDNTDGKMSFDIDSLINLINANPANVKTAHLSLADATSGINPISGIYENVQSPQQILFIRVVNPTGCVSIGNLTLRVLPLPNVGVNSIDEVCKGESNGQIQINVNSSTGPIQVNFDNKGFSTTLLYDSLASRTYRMVIRDSVGCSMADTVIIKQGLDILVDSFTYDCTNNGTVTDPLDDTYNINAVLSNNNANQGMVDIYINGMLSTSGNYGSFSFNIPATGGVDTIIFVDQERGCSEQRIVGPLDPCSTDCQISIDSIAYLCNDNGTDTNPSDDTYQVTFNVSAINGSPTGLFRLLIDNQVKGVYMYGQLTTISIPANSSDVLLSFIDANDNQCRVTYTLQDLVPCSDGCAVNANLLSNLCNNNNTTIDVNDDFYTLTLLTQSVNIVGATYELWIDGVREGSYNYRDTVRVNIPADGLAHQLWTVDLDRSICADTLSTSVLNPCSSVCGLEVSVSNIRCDNNGTNHITADDTYTFEISATRPNGVSYIIPSLNISGRYGLINEIGPLFITGGLLQLEVIDSVLSECRETVVVSPPPSCSECTQTLSLSVSNDISCLTPEAILSAVVTSGGRYEWWYQGEVIDTSRSLTVSNQGTYIFIANYADGCVLSDTVEVSGDGMVPVAVAGSDKILNCLISSVILGGNGTSQGPEYRYEWTDVDGNIVGTNRQLSVTIAGVYFLQVFNINNDCKSIKDRVAVTSLTNIPSTNIYPNPSEVFDCVISTILLSTDEEINVIYNWTTPEGPILNTRSIEITEPGSYTLIAIDTISSCADTSNITILSFEEYPRVDIEILDSLDCITTSIEAVVSLANAINDISLEWVDLSTQTIIGGDSILTITEPGLYEVTATDITNGCQNSDTIEVVTYGGDVEISVEIEVSILAGESLVLTPIINLTSAEIAYVNWTPIGGLSCADCLSPIANPSEDTRYTVEVADIYGCVGSASILVRVRAKEIITVPDIISIGTSNNNVFTIYSSDEATTIKDMRIYDRWGNQIFFANNVPVNTPSVGWDGSFNGKAVVPGVYVYKVQLLQSNGKIVPLAGDITVLR